MFKPALATMAVLLALVGNRAAAAEGDETEKLLKEAKFPYTKVKEGVFKFTVEDPQGRASVVFAEEKVLLKTDAGPVKYCQFVSLVMVIPKDTKPPAAMLSKIADINGRLSFGSISVEQNDQGAFVFRNHSMFLKNAEPIQFQSLSYMCHFDKFELEKLLKNYLD